MSKGTVSLAFIIVTTVGLFSATLALGNEPLLGLDLQGGASVVLQPTEAVPDDSLNQAVEIVRSRVDGLGVAEPDITRQGDTILVQLPGVDNQERALELVGQTAELRFRPVLAVLPPLPEDGAGPTTSVPGGPTTTTVTGGPPSTITDGPADEQGLAPPPAVAGESALGLQAGPATTAPAPTVPLDLTEELSEEQLAELLAQQGEGSDQPLPENLDAEGLTPREEDDPDAVVVLPERDDDGNVIDRFLLGPELLTGSALEGAQALTDQTGAQWQVNPTFKSGADGIDLFNQAAGTCNTAAPECPTGQLAIVLDSEVISAPAIQQPTFERDQITISGSFDEREAKDLALVLRFGALPVELEPQQVQTVSATLGRDSLEAGVVAGLIGLAIVALFMIAYYRLLGVIAMASLMLSSMLLWSIISYLGESRGLALTLAGVTGIIVSIGVSLDSNVVYFEHLKADVRNGRTIRSSVERSFAAAFSTIVKADVASLIGAGVLYYLTVGPVRGFALYLGLATILDLVVSWFFMRPAVIVAGRSKRLRNRAAVFGIPIPADDAASPPASVVS